MEEYKIINEYTDYEISNFGNCRTVKGKKILKPILYKNGFKFYELSNKGNKSGIIGLYHIGNKNDFPDTEQIFNIIRN